MRVIVCGGSAGMWQDLEEVRSMAPDAHLCALNCVGMFLPRMDHWCITSMEAVGPLCRARETVRSAAHDCTVHSPGYEFLPAMADGHRYWKISTKGTIALFAVQVLSFLGYKRIVLAGCGLSDKPYFYGPPHEIFRLSNDQARAWEDGAENLKSRVRSMSGFTGDLLGRPDAGWLKEV